MEDRFANGRNFLATDKVPDTIFGIPVASKREQYTKEDLAFFRDHPEAGGYYTTGGDGEEAPQEDVVQEAPVELQGAAKGGDFNARAAQAIRKVIPFLKSHEGFRPDAYKDTNGVWTIGYGQTNVSGRAVGEGDRGMKEPEAAKWMEDLVHRNAKELHGRNPWMQKLSAGALAAAYDLAYNMGAGVFSKEKSPGFNRRIAAGEDPEKVFWSELPTYVGGKDASEQTRKGLTNRRNDAIKEWKK